jgi:hypothetical protein
MLSGVVQVETYPLLGAGLLALVGDNSAHSVKITSTPGAGLDSYTITSKDGTLFQLNGAGTFTSLQVNGITGDITVSLGAGGPNTLDFEAPAATPGSVSTVLSSLIIENASVQTNVINNVVIQGNLTLCAFGGYKELDMLGTQVNGCTEINNYASAGGIAPPAGAPTFSGDSYANLTNCVFEGLNVKPGGATAAALEIDNGVGNNIVFIQSASPAPGNETSSLTKTQIGYQTTTAVTALAVNKTTWAKSAESPSAAEAMPH